MMMNDGCCSAVVGSYTIRRPRPATTTFGAHFSKVFFCPLGLSRCCGPYFYTKRANERNDGSFFFFFSSTIFQTQILPASGFFFFFFFKRMSFPLFFIISNYTCPLLLLLQGANKKKSFLTCRWALLVDGQVWGDWINLLLLLLLLPLVA